MSALVLAALLQMGPPPAPPPDVALTARARAIAERAGLPVTGIAVYVWDPWRGEYRVDAQTWVAAGYVSIFISPLILDDADKDGVDGLLAHELAHFGTKCGRGRADGKDRYRNDDELVACESKADARAASWVGRRTVIRGLCQLMAISWYWKFTTDGTVLTRRIRLLHDRKDIP